MVALGSLVGCGSSSNGSTGEALVVGTNAAFPPFEYVGDDGKPDGFDIALIKAIGEKAGMEVQIQDMEFASLVTSIGSKIDGAIAGIRALVGGEGTTLEYDGISLGVGGWEPDAAPVTALPLLLSALKGGSTLRGWTEWEEERTLFVREFYVTDGATLRVWLDAATLLPAYAELAENGETVLRCEIRDFSYR